MECQLPGVCDSPLFFLGKGGGLQVLVFSGRCSASVGLFPARTDPCPPGGVQVSVPTHPKMDLLTFLHLVLMFMLLEF